jgi:hypothetical protein
VSTAVRQQVAVTLNGTTGIMYLDGVAVGTNSSMTLNPSSMGITTNNYLGKSQYADPCLDGVLDEFRIYSGVLSPSEIAATVALGSNQLLSTNSPVMSTVTAGTNLTLSWLLASANFTLQSCTNLVSGNWVTAPAPAPQIVGKQWQVTVPTSGNIGTTFYRLVK